MKKFLLCLTIFCLLVSFASIFTVSAENNLPTDIQTVANMQYWESIWQSLLNDNERANQISNLMSYNYYNIYIYNDSNWDGTRRFNLVCVGSSESMGIFQRSFVVKKSSQKTIFGYTAYYSTNNGTVSFSNNGDTFVDISSIYVTSGQWGVGQYVQKVVPSDIYTIAKGTPIKTYNTLVDFGNGENGTDFYPYPYTPTYENISAEREAMENITSGMETAEQFSIGIDNNGEKFFLTSIIGNAELDFKKITDIWNAFIKTEDGLPSDIRFTYKDEEYTFFSASAFSSSISVIRPILQVILSIGFIFWVYKILSSMFNLRNVLGGA